MCKEESLVFKTAIRERGQGSHFLDAHNDTCSALEQSDQTQEKTISYETALGGFYT